MSDNALVVWCLGIICACLLLAGGSPDLLDAIMNRLNGAPCHVETTTPGKGADHAP